MGNLRGKNDMKRLKILVFCYIILPLHYILGESIVLFTLLYYHVVTFQIKLFNLFMSTQNKFVWTNLNYLINKTKKALILIIGKMLNINIIRIQANNWSNPRSFSHFYQLKLITRKRKFAVKCRPLGFVLPTVVMSFDSVPLRALS